MKRAAKYWTLSLSLVAVLTVCATAHAGDTVRIWVQFTPGQKAAVKNALHAGGARVHHEFDDLSAVAVSIPAVALDALSRNPNVQLIEEDPPRYLLGQTVPYGIDKVQARDVWDVNRDGVVDAGAPTGAGCKVCVIDSGLYTAHEDLAGVRMTGEPSGWNSDVCGHGTHVVGTIVAANNDKGVVGVTPGAAAIHMVKVFGDDCRWTYSSDLVAAANRCKVAGAKIISMSLGGTSKSLTEEQAFQDLYNQGYLSVAAAGNAGNNQHNYPASYPSVISVAATDQNDTVASFSQRNDQVELSAPGVSVLSTVPSTTASLTVDNAQFAASAIENAAYGTTSGALVNGGLCDSVGSWAGKVVLCQRGVVTFYTKVINVQNSGGRAAVIYNNAPGNFSGTLGAGNFSSIPAISISQEDGQFLVANKLGFIATVSSTAPQTGSGYAYSDGTSMATPHVSAVAAIVWNCDASKSNAQIRDALQKTAKDLGTAGRDNSYGFGLVQAKAALDHLKATTPPKATEVKVVSVTYATQGGKLHNRDLIVTVNLRDDLGNAVGGASVSVNIFRNGSPVFVGTGTTQPSGKVSFVLKNAPAGNYTTVVTNVSATGLTWDGVTPQNGFTKN